jgi:HPt (histidine-containing phosphotransfer) domain-containing protein
MKVGHFIILIALSTHLMAAIQTSDILDDERILFLKEDDPREVLQLARDVIARGPADQEKLWVRAVWAESSVPTDFGEKTSTEEDRLKARRLALELGMLREAMDLELDGVLDDPKANKQQEFEQLLKQAELMREPLVASRVLREHAFWLYERGEMLKSIELQNRSAEFLDQVPKLPVIERLRLKIDMAMVLDTEGQPQRARQLYEEIAKQCAITPMRSLCITNAHEMGLHYSASQNEKDWPTAVVWFKKAFDEAREFDDRWTIAKAEAALSSVYTKLRKHDEAIALGQQAVADFLPFKNSLWTGDAYKKLGSAYGGAQKHGEAIVALQKAQELIAEDYLQDQSEIHRLLAASWEALQDEAKALAHLKRHLALSDKIKNEREAREYSKAMVDLGLRVEEERNKALEAENSMQNQRLRDAERLRFLLMISLILAALAIASLLLAAYRSRQLRRGELHMRRILQQIQEGILTFDAQLRIRSGYSQYVENVFGRTLVGQHILRDVLAAGPFTGDEIHTFEEVLTLSMSEGPLTWEFNQHLLPWELTWKKDRIFTLHWQPIYGSHGRMSSILLSFRDITHQKELMEQLAWERLRSDRITRCLQELIELGPDKTQRVFQETRAFLKGCPNWIAQGQVTTIFRQLHTLKGLARSLGLRELAQAAHDLEDVFMNKIPEKAEIEDALERFQNSFAAYTALELYGTTVHYPGKTLLASLDPLLPSLRQRSEESGLDFQGVTARDQVRIWPAAILEKLEAIFVHALNNVIDHGYLQPRKEGHTVGAVRIEVEADEDAAGIHLTIRDYGHGIAWTKLRERARRLGRSSLTDAELTQLVFEDRLSTSNEISATSGRGIGMSAVRSLCEEEGGSVQFQANDRGQGAILRLSWPQPRALSSGF